MVLLARDRRGMRVRLTGYAMRRPRGTANLRATPRHIRFGSVRRAPVGSVREGAGGRSSGTAKSQRGFGSMRGRNTFRTHGLASTIEIAREANTIESSHTAEAWSSFSTPDSRIG